MWKSSLQYMPLPFSLNIDRNFSMLLSIVPADRTTGQLQLMALLTAAGQLSEWHTVFPNESCYTRKLTISAGEAMAIDFFVGRDHKKDSNCFWREHFWRS